MEEGSELMEDIVFRGVEFSVKIEVDKGLLVVEISDLMTADQWKGEFDPAYIEDLTRKTGNFKQFPIFCSMLESAVRKEAHQGAVVRFIPQINRLTQPSWIAASDGTPGSALKIFCELEDHSNQNLQLVKNWFMCCYTKATEQNEEYLRKLQFKTLESDIIQVMRNSVQD